MENKIDNKNSKTLAILFTILIIIFSFSVVMRTFQNDTFFNITIGKYIVENGIDMMDHFCWVDNLEYTYSHWAFDIVTYLIYSVFGFRGIYIGVIAFTAATSAIVFNLINKKISRPIIAFVITLFTIFFIGSNFTARSQLISFVFFFIEVYCIEKYIETSKVKYAITIIIISIIVANFHAATWPLLLVLFLPYFAAALLSFFSSKKIFLISANLSLRKANKYKDIDQKKYEKYKKDFLDYTRFANEDRKEYKRIIIKESYNMKNVIFLFIIVCFTGFVTPIHGVPYTYILKSMFGKTNLPYPAIAYVSEMQPIIPLVSVSILFFTALLSINLLIPTTKIKLEDLFLISGLYLMALYSKRYSVLLILIGSLVLADLSKQTLTLEFKEEGLDLLEKISSSVIVMIILTLTVTVYSSICMAKHSTESYLDLNLCPVGAVDYILDNIDYKNMRIYNQYTNGSYLMFNNIPVFIDSRLDVYCREFADTEIFKDYIEAEFGHSNYKDVFEKYDFTHLLIEKNSIIDVYIQYDPDYKELYSDEYFALYEVL